VLRAGAERWVWTVDGSVEGVHFDRRWLSLEDVGWRSFQAAASDLAAMGARPIAALCNLALPESTSRSELAALARGQAAAARALRCPIAGGNLSRSRELAVTTTLLGRAARPILRSGARPGDELWLIGDVGLARAGLLALERGVRVGPALRAAVAAWRRPRALVTRGLGLVGRARALLDVSDGLGGDLGHLAEASGVRAIVERARIEHALPRTLARAARALGVEALDLALAGGEDYALLAAGPAKLRPRFARTIGRIERGRGAWLEGARGERVRLGPGFDHLAGITCTPPASRRRAKRRSRSR
jgi:thiamine-monophosphate kinase